MTTYAAPVQDMRFTLSNVAGFDRVAGLPGLEQVTPDLVGAVLEEASKFAGNVLAPLNRTGDQVGATLENGVVRTAPGFKDAYRQFVEGGWNSVPFDPDHGGQGLPWALAFAVQEMWQAANMSYGLSMLLTQGAVELLTEHGSPEQKGLYLPKLISGEWTGTMNLTEPQAGSDVGAVRTRAEPDGGHYRIRGQKIFITYGEHDMAENIVHMVLARLPDAPPGVKGISLFLVPKFLVNPDGSLGARNDLRCVSLEHKLGIHASPTCVMAYGDDKGAIGYLIGEPHRGIEYMFTMMNNARLSVGLQGVAIAERAYQQARDYARTRVQSRELGSAKPEGVPIIRHPDVRRMLLAMRSQTEAGRALLYSAAVSIDEAKRHPDPAARRAAQARVDLLTPVCKAWSTDMGVEVASIGVQVHGGMGFIEETGAAQHLRDARILPIYEGTNGIQANDLVFRKLGRDRGAAAGAFLAEMSASVEALRGHRGDDAQVIADRLAEAVDALKAATAWMVEQVQADPVAAAAGAANYLRMFGLTAGGHMMGRAAVACLDAMAAGEGDPAFHDAKLISARFYAEQMLPQVGGLTPIVTHGHRSVMAMPEAAF